MPDTLQMELFAYKDVLEFHHEYQLTSEPLRIDAHRMCGIVIKKIKNAVIDKNIAAIFREWNIIEYKSPDDYISIADFYKVYGYTCLYVAQKKIPISDVTISFAGSRYPRKLIRHLEKESGYKIEGNGKGIYTVKGGIVPVQIIDSRNLSEEENLWLKSLRDGLDIHEVSRISEEIAKYDKIAPVGAYLDIIARANSKKMKEAMNMRRAPTMEQALEDIGLTAKWEARGKIEGKIEVAQKMKTLGDSADRIQIITGLSPEDIAKL